MEGQRGFVTFLFLHGGSCGGTHHPKHKNTKLSQQNLRLYWNIDNMSFLWGIMDIWENLK